MPRPSRLFNKFTMKTVLMLPRSFYILYTGQITFPFFITVLLKMNISFSYRLQIKQLVGTLLIKLTSFTPQFEHWSWVLQFKILNIFNFSVVRHNYTTYNKSRTFPIEPFFPISDSLEISPPPTGQFSREKMYKCMYY